MHKKCCVRERLYGRRCGWKITGREVHGRWFLRKWRDWATRMFARGANLVVRREATAPRRLRKQDTGANSPPTFPCKTSRAFYPDTALPRRCRASLATALQGVPRVFAGFHFVNPVDSVLGKHGSTHHHATPHLFSIPALSLNMAYSTLFIPTA